MVLKVEESSRLETTVASKVEPRAGDELLLGLSEELASLDEMGTLEGSSGREGPA